MKNRKPVFIWMTLLLIGLLSIGALEVLIRIKAEKDLDGNVWFKGRMIHVESLPVAEMSKQLNDLNSALHSYIIYDQWLGWTNSRDFESEDKSYIHNDQHLRVGDVNQHFNDDRSDKIRVAFIGDSYIYGAEVSYKESLVGLVDIGLDTIDYEVMNFGVGGYGMDQAYLRLKHEVLDFHPDWVIFGFQPENCHRNFNLIRALYSKHEASPFSKPMFTQSGKEFELLNYPTMLPPQMIESLGEDELWQKDEFMKDYSNKSHVLYSIGFLSSFWNENRWNIYRNEQAFMESERNFNKTKYIVKLMGQLCEENEIDFAMVHLPRKEDLLHLKNGEELNYNSLLHDMKDNYLVIDPTQDLLTNSIDALFAPGFHYSAQGNEIVSKKVINFIKESGISEDNH